MADKEKKAAGSGKKNDETEESKAAKKVANAAKAKSKKSDKPNVFVRMGKWFKNFFKNIVGECKKIVWPDAKTVLKSTGVVLLTVIIVGLIIWGIDTGLTAGVQGLKGLASKEEVETTIEETTQEGETTTADAKDDEDAEETTEQKTTAEETTEAETTADSAATEAETTKAE